MNKLESEKKYEEIKALHRAAAHQKEKSIKRDLSLLMSSATPRFLREKLVMSCVVFGAVYLTEELLFRKRIPGIVKFVGAVSATAFAPKIYRTLYANFYQPDEVAPPVSRPATPPPSAVAPAEPISLGNVPPTSPRTFPTDG